MIPSRHTGTRSGQGFLALVFLIGTVTVGIGLTLIFLANSSVNTIYGYQASTRAQAVAVSGAEDGLLQLARNTSFTSGGYTITVGSDTASVVVTQTSSLQTATIISSATVSNYTRKIQVIASVNASTSQVAVISWNNTQ